MVSDADLEISTKAENTSATNTAAVVYAKEAVIDYQVAGKLTIDAQAIGDIDSADGTYGAVHSTNTKSTATALKLMGSKMSVMADSLEVKAFTDKGDGLNNSNAITAYDSVIDVHTAGAIKIEATNGSKADYGEIKVRNASAIVGGGSTLSFVSESGGIVVTAIRHDGDAAMEVYDSVGGVNFDAKDAAEGIVFNGNVTVTESTFNLKSNTAVNGNKQGGGDDSGYSDGYLDVTGTTMNLTDNLSTLTVADTTTMKTSTVYFYDDNNQADKYNTADYRTITTDKNCLLAARMSCLCVPTLTASTASWQATIRSFLQILLPAAVLMTLQCLTRACATAIKIPLVRRTKVICRMM